MLRSREEYICNLYDKVANAAHHNEFVRSKYFVKVEETQTLIGKNADLEKEINRLSIELEEMKAKCKSLQKENNDLKIMIKNKDNELALKVYKDGLTVKSDLRRFGIDMADAESGEKADKRSKVINLMPYNEED